MDKREIAVPRERSKLRNPKKHRETIAQRYNVWAPGKWVLTAAPLPTRVG